MKASSDRNTPLLKALWLALGLGALLHMGVSEWGSTPRVLCGMAAATLLGMGISPGIRGRLHLVRNRVLLALVAGLAGAFLLLVASWWQVLGLLLSPDWTLFGASALLGLAGGGWPGPWLVGFPFLPT